MNALKHAWIEGVAAANLANGAFPSFQFRVDFLLSRLLRLGRLPGYNAGRTVRLKDGTTLHYRFNRGDLQSLREVFLEEVYACELPFELGTMLDLGANIGLTSVWMACRQRLRHDLLASFGPLYVIAVEPVRANADVAVKNFQANQVSGSVVCAAVGQRTGVVSFSVRAESNLGKIVSVANHSDTISVPMVGIRELLEQFPNGTVDLVKMDIEGSENALLSKHTDWLTKVRALMIEWHDEITPSPPLIQNLVSSGFHHRPMNAARQENLSLFVKAQS
jgi:FkbM family methyltransferase